MKENKTIYFSHDTNASNDPKLVNIRISFGWAGIGMYWAIIEALHKERDGKLPEGLISSMIYDFHCQEEIRTSTRMRDDAKPFEEALYANALLVKCDGITTSKRVQENLEEINSKSDKARESAIIGWNIRRNTSQKDANALRPLCERNAIKESKVKESKVNTNIEREEKPHSQTKEFFNNTTEQNRVKEELTLKGYEENFVKNELVKFISYWTEPNRSGTKQRWELEKTFEISRRLATWFLRINNFKNNKVIQSI